MRPEAELERFGPPMPWRRRWRRYRYPEVSPTPLAAALVVLAALAATLIPVPAAITGMAVVLVAIGVDAWMVRRPRPFDERSLRS
jgi:hypothetical protein